MASFGGNMSSWARAAGAVLMVVAVMLAGTSSALKLDIAPVTFDIDNHLDAPLEVVLTAAVLGSEQVVMVPPFGVRPIELNALAPASAPELTVQVLPRPEKYAIVGNAASRVVSLTGLLTIEVLEFCPPSETTNGLPGLRLIVTNDLDVDTEAICAEQV